MSKRQQSPKTNVHQKKQAKPGSARKQVDQAGNFAQLAPELVAEVDGGSVQAQRAWLGDPRLQGEQRQAMAAHISRRQGNRHLQRVLSAVQRKKNSDGSPEQDNKFQLPVLADAGNFSSLQRRESAAEESESAEEAGPTEAEKAEALAKAAAAKAVAAQAAATGREEVAKSKGEQAKEKQAKESAKQKVGEAKAKGEGNKEAPEKTALLKEEGKAEKASASPSKTAIGADSGQADSVDSMQEGSESNGQAPKSPTADPAFQAVVGSIKGVAKTQQAHKPASKKAAEAQAAAESPASEVESKAQANQVGEMEQVEAPPFNAGAFKAQLMNRIQSLTPETAKDADEFKESDKLGSVKGEMQGQVSQEKESSQAPLKEKTEEAPDTAGIEPKPVAPLTPEDPGSPPPDVGATKAVPKTKGKGEVEAPMQAESKKLDQKMAEADITEEQLAKSNEPEFQAALGAKSEAQTHAQQAPQEYRQFEQGQLTQAQGEAAALTQEKTQAMHGDRAQVLGLVEGQQGQAKSEDEKARTEVAAHIQGIYDQTQGRVEEILSELDQKVEKTFDEGAITAKKAFEDYVDAKMDAYKEERYGGLLGWAQWVEDKFTGMPSEVNAFYAQGRELFIKKMDAVIDNVVEIVGADLTKAKAEIAKGKQEIQTYVAQLPQNLQAVGQQAAEDISSKFDELEQSVDSKQDELVNTLAQKYQENLQAVDSRIEEMKAANKGLIDKAMDAVVGTVKTIMELKDMLLNVLAEAAGAITNIIKDPIGFLGNLLAGVKQGFQNFVANIGTHLKKGLMSWLFGAVAETGIELPESFDMKGILSLAAQVLGLTWTNIREKAADIFGEEVVSHLESAFEIFMIIKEQGLGGLWDYIQDMLGDLKSMVIDTIKDMVITQVIQAGVQWLIGILGGPAGAFIKAAKAIYDVIMWFVNNGSRVMSLVQAIIKSVSSIAAGAIGDAAKYIEESLAKAIPVVISFLASLLGLGDLGKKIKDVLKKLQKPVNKAINWVLKKAKKVVKKIGGALGFGKDKDDKSKVEAGKAAIVEKERKFSKNGKISKVDAQKVAAAVQSSQAVFKSVQVVDGGDSWNYDYVIQRTDDDIDTGKAKAEDEGDNSEIPEDLIDELGSVVANKLVTELGMDTTVRLFNNMNLTTFHKLSLKDSIAKVGIDVFITLVKDDVDSMIKYGAEALQKVGRSSLTKAANIFTTTITDKKLQKKWKHASDFEVTTSWKAKDIVAHNKFKDALNDVVANAEEVFVGPYHGLSYAPHFFKDDKVVITDLSGGFISGWSNVSGKLAGIKVAAPPSGNSNFRVR